MSPSVRLGRAMREAFLREEERSVNKILPTRMADGRGAVRGMLGSCYNPSDMENPFLKAPASLVESELRDEAGILADVAKTRLDDILSAEEWKCAGLDVVNPYTPDEPFWWSVYVSSGSAGKLIGTKIFTNAGMYDIREFACPDASLPLSTRQDAVDAEITRLVAAARTRQDEAVRERRMAAEASRGFPDGEYAVKVSYPHRSGEWRTMVAGVLEVRTEDGRADVFHQVIDRIQMEGLHNFGLKTPSRGGVEVEAWIENTQGVKVALSCRVDAAGHIVARG